MLFFFLPFSFAYAVRSKASQLESILLTKAIDLANLTQHYLQIISTVRSCKMSASA